MKNIAINQLQHYGGKMGFGLTPALFISDMQNAYTNPDYARGMDVSKDGVFRAGSDNLLLPNSCDSLLPNPPALPK